MAECNSFLHGTSLHMCLNGVGFEGGIFVMLAKWHISRCK